MPDTNCIIGISELRVSRNPDETILTYSLGSCLGLSIYDPVNRIGGMVHCLLPSSQTDPSKADAKPAMFVDSGVPLLFQSVYKLGAQRENLIIKAAGCGDMLHTSEIFQIGKRNYAMLKKLLWKNKLMIKAESVGGAIPRTLSLRISDGLVQIKSHGKVVDL
jgi:chemotaxis protein CheD